MIEATPEELALIGKIANRATDHYRRNAVLSERTARTWAKSAIADELLTVHEEIMALRLADLLTAPISDFLHDIGGIHAHLSRSNPPHLKDQIRAPLRREETAMSIIEHATAEHGRIRALWRPARRLGRQTVRTVFGSALCVFSNRRGARAD